MRTNESWPRCLSAMILKTRPANGAPAQVFRNLDGLVLRALRLVLPHQPLHRDQINDALELVFEADGNLDGDGVRAQAVNDRLERAVEAGPGAVELVDEADARDAVL